MNLYGFAGGDPVNFSDPFGLFPDTLKYNGSRLTLVGDDGRQKWQGDAYSGKPGSTAADQGEASQGPIPEGTYTLDPGEISHVTGLRAFARNLLGDWGSYRAPLHPTPGTDTLGRSGFFLHGGDSPGSLGCIDVCRGEQSLFPLLVQHQGLITEIVDYPSPSTVTTPR